MATLVTTFVALRKFEIAFITLFAGLLVSRILGKIARRLLAEADLNKLFAAKGARSISDILGGTIEGILYLVTAGIVLQQLDLAVIVLQVVRIIVVILGLLLLFFAAQQFPNVLTGLLMRRSMEKNKGKRVRINQLEGELEHVGLFNIQIKGKETMLIPNVYAWKKIKKIQAS